MARKSTKTALSADVVPMTRTQKAARQAAGIAPAPATKIIITPPKLATATVTIIGKAPYLQNRFSSDNRDKMMEAQKAGSAAKKTRKAKAPKDFEKVYRGSMHVSQDGWHGIPCTALRNAMIDACRLTEMDMVRAKMCIFIVEQGLDKENLEPLVKIDGKPQMHIERVKVGMGSTDLAARAMFVKWSSTFEITWDDDVFHAQDIMNLLSRAGWQVGIGAGRPFSKMSGGTGKGTFEVKQS
jgi:hypothetical protein